MTRLSGAAVGGQPPSREQQPSSGKAQRLGLHFGDPFGSWGDNALSLLSAQASLSAELASPRKGADVPPDAICRSTPRSGDAQLGTNATGEAAQQQHEQEAMQPCDSDGLTADAGSDLPDGGETSPAPVNSGTTAAPPDDGPNGSSPPPVQQPGKGSRRIKKGRGGIYADLIGREVDVPASVFDIQVPDLFYRAVVKRKDPAHPGAVVIRFPEDGSTFWLPADEVAGYIGDMEARRGLGNKSLAGERCAAYAAEVLVSLSGVAGSTGTQHSPGAGGGDNSQAAGREARHSGEVEQPARKRVKS